MLCMYLLLCKCQCNAIAVRVCNLITSIGMLGITKITLFSCLLVRRSKETDLAEIYSRETKVGGYGQ